MTEENRDKRELNQRQPEAKSDWVPSGYSFPSQDQLNADADVPAQTEDDDRATRASISTADKIKFIGLIAFVVLIIACGVMLMPYIQQLNSEAGRTQLVTDIRGAGFLGVLMCLGMQFLQVVVAFIPGELTQLVIGLLYGTIWGSLVTIIGALIPSVFVFYIVRKLGAPFVQAMIGRNDSGRLRFLQESKQLDTVVFILYLIPGLPKDIFNYVLPLTKIKPSSFFVLSTIGRIPGIVGSAYIGSSFWQGNYLGMVIVGVLLGGLGLVGIVFNQKIIALVDRVAAKFSSAEKSEDKD
jgi:uncharacterized membrane protein YdjX (TVP38/TMEM64 family)